MWTPCRTLQGRVSGTNPQYACPMRKLLGGFVLGVVVVLAVQFLFLTQGGMPVATQGGPMPLERFMASRALHAAMSRESGTPSPVPADAPNLLAGARVYRENCMVCHGTLGQKEPTPIARGMYLRIVDA